MKTVDCGFCHGCVGLGGEVKTEVSSENVVRGRNSFCVMVA